MQPAFHFNLRQESTSLLPGGGRAPGGSRGASRPHCVEPLHTPPWRAGTRFHLGRPFVAAGRPWGRGLCCGSVSQEVMRAMVQGRALACMGETLGMTEGH